MGWHLRSIAWLLLAAVCAGAQEPAADLAPGEAAKPIHTLHVYMDLIQVPVLVLDSELGRMKPIKPNSFFVSLDDGPTFRPRSVRQEGDDPITLGILLDPSAERDLMPRMSDAIAGLAPNSLYPADHVTLFAMDCGLIRTLDDVPAAVPQLKSGVDRALARWNERRKMKPPPVCAKPVFLWDAMGLAMKELGRQPGRRVLLVVSNGNDGGSVSKADQLRMYAQSEGIAVFGYRQQPSRLDGGWSPRGRGLGMSISTAGNGAGATFDTICQLSGGMIIPADSQFVARELARFVTTVRERYILEFSRPRNGEPGEHHIAVTLPKAAPLGYIRTAGVTIVNRTTPADDDTIPTDDSGAPVYGTKKIGKPD